MPLMYRNPLLPVQPLYDDMDRLVTGLLGQTPDWTLPGAFGALHGLPPVDVWQDGEKIVVEAEIPGLKSDQIEISVIGDELSLKFQRPELARRPEVLSPRTPRRVVRAWCGCPPKSMPPALKPSCTTGSGASRCQVGGGQGPQDHGEDRLTRAQSVFSPRRASCSRFLRCWGLIAKPQQRPFRPVGAAEDGLAIHLWELLGRRSSRPVCRCSAAMVAETFLTFP